VIFMKKNVFKKNPLMVLVFGIFPFIFTGMIIIALLFGFQNADEASRAEGARLLEESITRVVIHSYAVNGRFPESLDDIVYDYDIYINHERFLVHYEVFGSNMLPTIFVFQMD